MRFLFFVPPADGEVNPTMAIISSLLKHNSDDEVYLASGPAIKDLVDPVSRANPRLHVMVIQNKGHGVTDTLHPRDYSSGLAHPRGDPTAMYRHYDQQGYSTIEGMLATVDAVKQILQEIKPDIAIINGGSQCAFDTLRLLKIPFIRTSFSHPAGVFKINPLTGPLPLSGVTWVGSIRNIIDNFKFIWKHILYGKNSRLCDDVIAFRRKELGLKPLYFVDNGCYAPPSEMVPEVCCTILGNAEGILPGHIIVNLGTLFKWTAENTQRMLTALQETKRSQPTLRILWKVDLDQPVDAGYIRSERWFLSVKPIYTHPAVKAIVHHGGGNTFNEALMYGLPQLVIPQWMDTFDYAVTVEGLGLGLQTSQRDSFLDSGEIAQKLNTLLADRDKYMPQLQAWQEKARRSGGAETAAKLIREQATRHQDAYMQALKLTEPMKLEV